MLLLMLISCNGDNAKETAEPQVQLNGEEIYQKYCGICHGQEGEGYLAPAANALFNPEFLAASTDDFLVQGTVLGRPGTKMSPWGVSEGGPLDTEQVDLLIEFIRQQETLETADIHDMEFTGDLDNGASTYAQHCASCHGNEGEGTDLAMSLNNPIFLQTVFHAKKWYSDVSVITPSKSKMNALFSLFIIL